MRGKGELGLGIDELASFCKRKGFVYPSAELYGGLSGFWDFGHLGVEVVNNLKREWWTAHVRDREDVVGVDGSIITNPRVWEASGHVKNFVDVAVACKKCGYKTKVDKHELKNMKCEKCGGQYENLGEFNPMFVTEVGPVKKDAIKTYLRPETAQSIFTNFKIVYEQARLKLPFGIAQIGKAFRNEIAPREFLFRAREFEQMEMEYFIAPGMGCSKDFMYEIKNSEVVILTEEMQSKKQGARKMKLYDAWKKGLMIDWHAYWIARELEWFLSLGARAEKFRVRQHKSGEKSHYAVDTWDLEYEFPMGWRELQGFSNRGNYDLSQHMQASGQSFEVLVEDSGKKIVPEVVCEPSLGVGRAFLVFLLGAYEHDKKRDNVVLHLHPKLAPYTAAVFPIVKGDSYEKLAANIVRDLRKEFSILYDESGSIGRRYSRADEIGVPVTIVIDEQSLKDKSITLRDRDTTKQIRARIIEIKDIMRKMIDGENLLKLGKIVKTRVK